VEHYPIPFGTVTLMLTSLVLWLAGHGAIAGWTLLSLARKGSFEKVE
jgi:hypothetical protein